MLFLIPISVSAIIYDTDPDLTDLYRFEEGSGNIVDVLNASRYMTPANPTGSTINYQQPALSPYGSYSLNVNNGNWLWGSGADGEYMLPAPLTGNFTAGCWFSFSALPPDGVNTINNYGSAGGNGWYISFDDNDAGENNIKYRSASQDTTCEKGIPVFGITYLYGVWYNGTQVCAFRNSTKFDCKNHNTGVTNGDRPLTIGSGFNATPDNMNVTYDDCFAFQRALSNSELVDLETNGIQEEAPDVTPPTITILFPLNQTYNFSMWINFTTDEASTCSVNNTAFSEFSSNTTDFRYNESTLPNGYYEVNVSCEDGSSNENSTTAYFTKNVPDTTPPEITILFPQNQTYNFSMWINFTTNENSNCSLNNTAFSEFSATGTDFRYNENTLLNGFYAVNADCNDSSDNTGNAITYFTKEIICENIICTNFTVCQPDITGGYQNCTVVNETASCSYTGDYSEFQIWCNYCTKTEDTITGECDYDTGLRPISYNITNYASCCALTGNSTDCNATASYNEDCGYVQSYGSGEIAETIIDIIIGIFVVIFAFSGIIALVLLFVWVAKKLKE